MANEFDYRLISSIPDSYARGQEQAFQQAMRPMEMQNEFVRQRINQIRLKEAENEFATKMGRQQAAQKFFQPSQPAQTAVPMQTGAAPSYTGNAFADNMYGQRVETAPERPAGFDVAGYQANRMGAGDIEGAQAIPPPQAAQGGIADKDIVSIIKDLGADKFKALKPMLAKLNPNFALIDAEGLSVSQDGKEVAFPVLTPDGKPTGKAVIYGKDGNKQIVDVGEGSEKLPYKIGERQKFTGKDGSEYEGTFKGLDEKGEPKFENAVKVSKEKPLDPFAYDKSSKLRKEFLDQTKTFREVRDSYARINASAKDPSAAGDLALIFNYMKMLDPGSVVREGEFATAQNAAGVPDRIVAKYNQVISGERLAPDTRADFVNRAKELFGRQNSQTKKTRSEYERLAKSYGLEPSMVIVDIEDPMDVPAAAAPASGGKTAPAAAQSEFSVGPYKIRVKQ